MSKSIADYSKLKAYAESEEKKKEAINKAKEILEGSENKEPQIDAGASQSEDVVSQKQEETSITIPTEIGVSKNDSIFSNLEKVDDYFRSQKADSVKNTLGLEQLDGAVLTEEEARAGAKAKTDAKFDKLRENIETDYAKQESAKNQQKEKLENSYASDVFKVNEIYDNASSQAQNQALKRGLARSSIIINQLDGIEKERANKLTSLATTLSGDLAQIETDIASLNVAKDRALDSLDLDYATSLNEEIVSALENLNKKQKEIVEFNNKVKQLEAEYNLTKREKDTKELKARLSLNENYGYTEPQENLQQQYKIKLVMDYLNALPKNEALKALTTDSTYAYYLGQAWSDVYYNQVARKN